jgi:serine/threonine-protein kinase
VLHELLTGKAPHAGRSLLDVIRAASRSAPPRLGAEVPRELAEICRRAMHLEPEGRYPSAEALRFAIEAFLRHAGSSQLSLEADVRLAELRALLATTGANDAPAADDPDGEEAPQRRTRIYNLFGACRFGFRQALRSWPDNEDAKRGLRAATELMIELEMARGSAENADAILAELDDPPPALVRRVKAELVRSQDARSRADRLVRDHDPSIGGRTRVFLSSTLGLGWVVFPLIARFYESHYGAFTHDLTRGASVILAGIVAGMAYWGRESLSKTLINRRLVAIALFAFAGQLAMELGAQLLGLAPHVTQALHFFNYFVVTAMATLAIEKRLMWSALSYLVGFFVVCANTDTRWWMLSTCNLVLTINFLLAWRLYVPSHAELVATRRARMSAAERG